MPTLLRELILAVDPARLISSSSPWSLWVPLLLLGLIAVAAAYFARTRIR